MRSWNTTTRTITKKSSYQCIAITSHSGDLKWWYNPIWKINNSGKVICFMCLSLLDRILTVANYKKRTGIGPVVCSLCLQDYKTTQHLLIHFEVKKNIWKWIFKAINFPEEWGRRTIEKNLLQWFLKYPYLKCIPFLVSWGIWKYRNKVLFENWRRDDDKIAYYLTSMITKTKVSLKKWIFN